MTPGICPWTASVQKLERSGQSLLSALKLTQPLQPGMRINLIHTIPPARKQTADGGGNDHVSYGMLRSR